MNEVPPKQDPPEDVDEHYRRLAALDSSQPSESVRRAVLRNARQLAAERVSTQDPTKIASGRPAAIRIWRRPAIFGTLAAAALAGLLMTPLFFPPRAPSPAALSPTEVSRPNAAATPAPRAPDLEQSRTAVADEQPPPASAVAGAGQTPSAPSPQAHAQNHLRPRESAGNAASISDSAAKSSAKNAPSQAPSLVNAQKNRAAPIAPAARMADPAAELRRAAETGDLRELQALLEQQPVIDARDTGGRTALMLATLHGQSSAVDALLASGADPNAADAHGTTPLQAAVSIDQPAIAAALRRAGAR